jgi:hypothetical protein
MNTTIQLKQRTSVFIVAIGLACFALSPSMQAVSPAPDGGYAGANTAEGQNALFSLTTGGYNTASGFFSLRGDTTGSFNTAFGAGALFSNNADRNCAFGAVALFSDTGFDNSAFGYGALAFNTASNNAAFGAYALLSNTSGDFNTASGYAALQSNTTGVQNTAVGSGALLLNTTGGYNTAVGVNALLNNTGGIGNTAYGFQALLNNSSDNNTAVGSNAGESINGNYNVCIGAGVHGSGGDTNTIHIADNLPNGAYQSACYIGGIAGQTVDPSGAGTVYIDNSGKLGVFLSSERFKRDIEPMDKASEAILSLKPVIFHYKRDAKNTPCFGLIAEDVEKISPELVNRDKDGKPYAVRYDQVNAMLLNEFLKEHQTVQELKKEVAALTAGLQKVSAQLELSKAAPQTALTNR